MRNFAKNAALALGIFIALSLICSCENKELPAGIVATINGEPIALHTVQTLIDSRSASLGIPLRPSLGEMKKNYGVALGVLITHALVRQELAERGMDVPQREYDQMLADINTDMGENGLEDFMKESFMRMDDWHELLRDYLAMETFKNQVLLPSLKIDKSEIKNYYNLHKSEFHLPESVNVCFLTSDTKEGLQTWCANLAQHNFKSGPVVQCTDASVDEIPQAWRQDIKNLAPFTCGKIKQDGEEWQAVALVSREKSRTPSLPEVYALIENILLEQKKDTAFDQWLEHKIGTSQINVAPELQDCIAIAGQAGDGENLDTDERSTQPDS